MDANAQAELFTYLGEGFRQLYGNYSKMDAQNEKRIVRWRYAQNSAFALRYDYLRRSNHPPGDLTDTEPIATDMYYAYGYDAQGRLINESIFQLGPIPVRCLFYEYHMGRTDMAWFDLVPRTENYGLSRVGRLVHPDPAKPTCYAEYGLNSHQRISRLFETYTFAAAGRLSSITVTESFEPGQNAAENADNYNAALDQLVASFRDSGNAGQFDSGVPEIKKMRGNMANFRTSITSRENYEYEGDRLVRILSFMVDESLHSYQPRVLYVAPRETNEAIFAELESAFRQHAKNYATLDAANAQQVIRWRYAKRAAYTLRYDYLRRTNNRPDVLTDAEPVNEDMYYAYGFDDQGRIINDSEYQSEADPVRCRFYAHYAGHTDLAEFQRDFQTRRFYLIRVAHLAYANPAKPLFYAEYALNSDQRISRAYETYTFDSAGRPSVFTITESSEPGPGTAQGMQRFNEIFNQLLASSPLANSAALFDFTMPQLRDMNIGMANRHISNTCLHMYEYEGDRLMRIVERTPDEPPDSDDPMIIYRERRPNDTDKSLFEAARQSLRQRIIDLVSTFDRSHAEDTRMFCMTIHYDAALEEHFTIALLPQIQREDWLRQPGDHTYLTFEFLAP